MALLLQAFDAIPSWFPLLVQGGSFAVIVYLLMFGLPKLRKEVAEERKQDQVVFAAAIDKVVATFDAELKGERAFCDKHFTALADAVERGSKATMEMVKVVSEQMDSHSRRSEQWVELLRSEIGRRDPSVRTRATDEHKTDA